MIVFSNIQNAYDFYGYLAGDEFNPEKDFFEYSVKYSDRPFASKRLFIDCIAVMFSSLISWPDNQKIVDRFVYFVSNFSFFDKWLLRYGIVDDSSFYDFVDFCLGWTYHSKLRLRFFGYYGNRMYGELGEYISKSEAFRQNVSSIKIMWFCKTEQLNRILSKNK